MRDGRRLVGPLSLDVGAGERVALLGRSGAGKTTALRLINRLVDPTGGAALVEGRPTTDWDPVRLRRTIGYMVRETGLFPHFTVARNVEIVPWLEGWLAALGGTIDEAAMQHMNYLVDVEKRAVRDVAAEWLARQR